MPGLRGHRLLLLDRRVVRPVGAPEGAKESFAVMGATGNGEAGMAAWVCAASSTVHAFCACESLHCTACLLDARSACPPACVPHMVPPALRAVYNVTIGRHPACTCPDCGKGNICKHVLFVLLRVLHLPTNQPLVWQKALLPGEVDEVRHRAALGLATCCPSPKPPLLLAAAATRHGAEQAAAAFQACRC
jgi:hypothetical protein